MSIPHRIPAFALRQFLYNRIRLAGPEGLNRAQAIRFAREQGYTAGDARFQLHKLGEAGMVEHVTHPLEVRVCVATKEGEE